MIKYLLAALLLSTPALAKEETCVALTALKDGVEAHQGTWTPLNVYQFHLMRGYYLQEHQYFPASSNEFAALVHFDHWPDNQESNGVFFVDGAESCQYFVINSSVLSILNSLSK